MAGQSGLTIPLTDPRYRNLIALGGLSLPTYDALPDTWDGADIITVRGGTQTAPTYTYYYWSGTLWVPFSTVPADFYLSGDISPTQITANQNNYNPPNLATASVLRLTSDVTRTITGIAGGADGRVLILFNVNSAVADRDILLAHDVTSTEANRFYAPMAENYRLRPQAGALLWYDITSSRWRIGHQRIGERALVIGRSGTMVAGDGGSSTTPRADFSIVIPFACTVIREKAWSSSGTVSATKKFKLLKSTDDGASFAQVGSEVSVASRVGTATPTPFDLAEGNVVNLAVTDSAGATGINMAFEIVVV